MLMGVSYGRPCWEQGSKQEFLEVLNRNFLLSLSKRHSTGYGRICNANAAVANANRALLAQFGIHCAIAVQ